MSHSELVRLYFERSTALQWYWVVSDLLTIAALWAMERRRRRAGPPLAVPTGASH